MSKKFFQFFFVVLFSFGLSSQSQGAAVLLLPTVIASLNPTLIAVTIFGAYGIANEYGFKYHGRLKSISYGYLTLGLLMKGEANTLQFRSLNQDEALKLNLTNEEHDSYESELPRVNALIEEAYIELAQASKENQKQVALALHKSFEEEMSPSTLKAVQKIFSANMGK